jgi:catechol 2,3-dioxygenase-like lactoylglutathione lyase family enzyme
MRVLLRLGRVALRARAKMSRTGENVATGGQYGCMSTWPGGISAITLFVEDLAASKEFYDRAFGLPIHYEDPNSAVYNFGNTLINLLEVGEAPSLIAPAKVAAPDAGSRVQFTIDVENVDAIAAELEKRGVKLLNGPMDRPWGIRTASFQDPGGHIWEFAH